MKKKSNIVLDLMIAASLLVTIGCGTYDGGNSVGGTTPVTIAAITGVTAPVGGETPVATITETDQYTGAVIWSPADAPFDYETVYTATITLTLKSGYTLTGVIENFFEVAGATATHNADSGVVTVVFPATGAVYAIGDTGPSGVGIVFYVTHGGLHGLEAAPSLWDGGTEDPEMQWKNAQTATSGTATGIGTGSTNTTAMAGAEHPAAQACRDYDGGDLTDWFLPSTDELNELYLNRVTVGGFADAWYWSSSQFSNARANAHLFTGTQSNLNKDTSTILVRPVRAF